MWQQSNHEVPKGWIKTIIREGTVYTHVSKISNDTRSCLIRNDMTVEVRANDLLASYPTTLQVADAKAIKKLLEKIQKAHFCVGTQEGYNCKKILFPVHERASSLCRFCPDCRVLRLKHKNYLYGRKSKFKLAGVSKEKKICVVKGCPGRDTAIIKNYPIPLSDIAAWCANLKLDVSEVNETTRVCSRHFEESCKKSRTLRVGSRPTLNLGHNDVLFKNEKLYNKINRRVCCIVDCKSANPPHRMFSFPKASEKERLKQWLLICVIKDDMIGNKQKYICGKHFDASMFRDKSLKHDAIPKMDAVSWLKHNTGTNVVVSPLTEAHKPNKKRKKVEPEVQALNDIQNALIVKVVTCQEAGADAESDSDILDSLECQNICLTCAKAFKDCETYRQGCCALEKQSQELQAQIDELENKNGVLVSKLQTNYVSYQDEE